MPIAVKPYNQDEDYIYPIQPRFLKQSPVGTYKLNITPYLQYTSSTSSKPTAQYPWILYFSAAASLSSSGQNTVYSQTVISTTVNLDFKYGDIQNLTIQSDTSLNILNIPQGSAMLVKCTLAETYHVSYNNKILINLPGTYFITFINITGTPEQLGDIVESNVVDI